MVFTWGWEGEDSPLPPGASTVEISLIAEGEGTLVRLRHLGLPGGQHTVHAEGWDHFLPRLIASVEGSDRGPDPPATQPEHTPAS